MSDRIITVVFKVKDGSEAAKIWYSHGRNEEICGCKVLAIAEGNAIKELNDLEEAQEFIDDYRTKYNTALLPDEHD